MVHLPTYCCNQISYKPLSPNFVFFSELSSKRSVEMTAMAIDHSALEMEEKCKFVNIGS